MSATSAPEAIANLVHAYYGLRDVEATLACVTENIVWVGTETADSAHGKRALRKLLTADVAAFSEPFDIELEEPVITELGDAAAGIWVTGRQVEVPGKVGGFALRGTAVCVKTAAGWLAASVHVSVPNAAIEKYSLARELDEDRKKEQLLMAHIPGGVAIYRLKKSGAVKTDFVSDGLAKMCGYSSGEEFRRLLAANALVNVVQEDIPLVMQAVETGLKEHHTVSVMYRIHTKGGEDILQRLDANLMEKDLGEDDLAVWYAVHTLVSDTSKAILRDQKDLHRLIDEVPTGIGIYEVDHGEVRQSYMNNAFYAMLGQDREARRGYTGADTLRAAHPDDVPAIRAAVTRLLAGDRHTQVTYRLNVGEGQWFWVHLAASVVERRDDYLKIYAAVSDYSEIMRTRQELETGRNTMHIALNAAKVFSWRYEPAAARITDTGTLGEAFHLPKVMENLPQAILDLGFVSPESEADFRRLYAEIGEGKQAATDVLSNVKGELGLRWFRQIYTPVYDESGHCREAIGIAIDISEQKHREHQYEDQLRLNNIAAQDALSRVSLNLTRNTITAFEGGADRFRRNAACRTAAELLASINVVLGDETERRKFDCVSTPQKIIEAYRAGTSHLEITYHADQGAIWQRVTYDTMENPYTGDMETISAIHDVTEGERAKLVMHQLLTIDYQSIALIDRKTHKLIPFRAGSTDRNLADVIELQSHHEDGELGLKAFLQKYALPGTAVQAIRENSIDTITAKLADAPFYETTYSLLRDDTPRHYRVLYSTVQRDSTVLLCAVQDITTLNEREEAQKKELADALAQAQAASRAKTAFLSRVSHDMRTPLNAILGLTALMKDAAISPKVLQDLGQLELSGQYLLNLINDTLDVSRIESGSMVLHPTVCDSRSVINNVIRLSLPNIKAKGIQLTVKAEELPLYPIYTDEGRLQQIAMNILGNAAKFTPAGGRIEVGGRNIFVRDGVIRDEFYVRDTGVGMSEEFLPHIFENFSQEDDTTTNSHHGTGLGMAITHQLVKLMGGQMEVSSRKGEGTCVRVVLDFPIAAEQQPAAQKAPAGHAAGGSLAGRRVLLCEDHALNTQIATRLLDKVQVQVEHAENGACGVELFARSAPGYYDAILMDIRMPVMDGLDAARAIRALDRPDAAVIPILAMTANALDEDVRHSHEAGMDAHLSKPIDPESLFRTLEQFIGPRKSKDVKTKGSV